MRREDLATGQWDTGGTKNYNNLFFGNGVQASMTVNRPQTGQMQSWTYTLPAELAGTLTNGRFKFGRGLRGRHFAFTLRLDGTRGYINDWQTLFAKSQRRI